jgi:hypothetical protein
VQTPRGLAEGHFLECSSIQHLASSIYIASSFLFRYSSFVSCFSLFHNRRCGILIGLLFKLEQLYIAIYKWFSIFLFAFFSSVLLQENVSDTIFVRSKYEKPNHNKNAMSGRRFSLRLVRV